MFNFLNTRYSRQEAMPEWGKDKQRQLRDARVAVVGAGGVKATTLMDLSAGGLGYIRIIDFDTVELSNLNRQLLYRTSDIGKPKALVAAETLRELNPDIEVAALLEKVVPENIKALLKDVDFVVEGGDSPAGRNLINEFCLRSGLPFVHASAQFSYGYVFSVVPAQRTACFACFFPQDHQRETTTGPVPVNALATSLAGTLGAAEVFKWFLGYRDRMCVNKRLCFSSLLLSSEFTYEALERRPDCPICSRYYS